MIFYVTAKNRPSVVYGIENALKKHFHAETTLFPVNPNCVVSNDQQPEGILVDLDSVDSGVAKIRRRYSNTPIIGVSSSSQAELCNEDGDLFVTHLLFLKTGGDRVCSINNEQVLSSHFKAVREYYERTVLVDNTLSEEPEEVSKDIACGSLTLSLSRIELFHGDRKLSSFLEEEATLNGKKIKPHKKFFTAAEKDILTALMQRPGIVKTREDLAMAARLEGDDLRIVDSHMKRIRKKIMPFLGVERELYDSTDPIKTKYGVGYYFDVSCVPTPEQAENAIQERRIAQGLIKGVDATVTAFKRPGDGREVANVPVPFIASAMGGK